MTPETRGGASTNCAFTKVKGVLAKPKAYNDLGIKVMPVAR